MSSIQQAMFMGAGVDPLILTVTATPANDSTDRSTTRTFSSQSIGTADADRWVIVVGCENTRSSAGTLTVGSATIGGVSANVIVTTPVSSSDFECLVFVLYAKVPTGTTANVVIDYSRSGSDTSDNSFITVYTTVSPTLTVHDTVTEVIACGVSTATIMSGLTIDAVEGRFIVGGISAGRTNGSTISLDNTNFTKDSSVTGNPLMASFSYSPTPGVIAGDASGTITSTTDGVAGLLVSFTI